jgi:hypothetical protein
MEEFKVKRDPWLTYFLVRKLDSSLEYTRHQQIQENERLEFDSFTNFSEKQAKYYETCEKEKVITIMHVNVKDNQLLKSEICCPLCKDSHSLFHCQEFQALEVLDRFNFVAEKKLCINCLQDRHWANTCLSLISCKKCGQRHSTLLHQEKPLAACSLTNFKNETSSILPTPQVQVCTNKQIKIIGKVLLDTGAQKNLVTEEFVNRLGMCNDINKSILLEFSSIAKETVKSFGIVTLTFQSLYNSKLYTIQANVIWTVITTTTQLYQVNKSKINY